MKQFLKEFLTNASIRRLIAILLTALFMYMAVKGKISSEQVTAIYGVIIGFYFGKSTALEMPAGYGPVNNQENKV